MSRARGALWIARQDVLTFLRERDMLGWLFIMPIPFFWFLGAAIGGPRGGPMDMGPEPLTVIVEGAGDEQGLDAALLRRLETVGFVLEDDPDGLRRLTVPEDFSASLRSGEVTTLTFQRRARGLSAELDTYRVGKAAGSLLADLVVLDAEGEPLDDAGVQRLAALQRPLQVEVVPAGRRRTIPSGHEQTIPGITVMFTMMILITTSGTMLVQERRQGLLRRLAAAPLGAGTVVTGKWLARMVLAAVQVTWAVLVGTFAFDMTWGPAPLHVGLLLLVWAAFCASAGLVTGVICRTEAQAGGLGAVVVLALAALGGCWWPIEITPQAMQDLAAWLPTGWAMEGMHRLVSYGDGLQAVIRPMGLLAAGALVLGTLAARRFRFE